MKSSFQNRCIILCSVMVAGLSVLSARLVQIQLVDRKRYAERSWSERHSTEILRAQRGMIVDRNEEPVAKSIPVCNVMIEKSHLLDPKLASFSLAYQEASLQPGWNELTPVEQRKRIFGLRGEILTKDSAEVIVNKYLASVIGVLARPLGMRREELRERIERNPKEKYFAIAKEIPQDAADQLRDIVKTQWMDGIEFENSIKRWYTSPKLATHLTGYTGEDQQKDDEGKVHYKVVGKTGVEASMESFLAGRDGSRDQYRDARGLVVPGNSGSLKPPRAGLNVKLTIDMGIQAIIEEELDAALAEFESKSGAVILMDPKTGEVLGMVSRPNFDLNLKENLLENGFNYAIQTIYEPGSTIKIVATSGALNEGLVSPQTSVFCHNGFYQGRGFVVRDDHPAGTLSFEGVLQKSNNNGTYSLGRQLGSSRFYDYLAAYGFGKKTGIQLIGESAGRARNTNREVDFSRACYGYATSVTPLQLACAYSVVAGDGKLRKPHIVKSLVANDGTVVESHEPEVIREVLKPKVAAQMRAALEKVVLQGGTATRAAVPGFRSGGKTGTVQKIRKDGRGYVANSYITSFVGMMPIENPAFVCAVVIDDPKTTKVTRYGGTVAAPAFGKIGARVAAYMNLQPTEPVTPPSVTASR